MLKLIFVKTIAHLLPRRLNFWLLITPAIVFMGVAFSGAAADTQRVDIGVAVRDVTPEVPIRGSVRPTRWISLGGPGNCLAL